MPFPFEIAGTEGSAVLEASRLVLHRGGEVERLGEDLAGGGGADPMAFDHRPHRAVLAEMLDAIEQDRAPSNDARSALLVQRLIEDLLRDAETRA